MINKLKDIFRIGKSASILLAADASAIFLSAVFAIFLGRNLGAEVFGTYTLAYIISSLCRTFVEGGYNFRIPRELAPDHGKLQSLVVEAQYFKNISWMIFAPIAVLVGISILDTYEFLILIVWILPVNLTATYRAVLQGLNRMSPIAFIEITVTLFATIANFLILYTEPSVALIFLVILLSESVKSIIYHRKVNSLIMDNPLSFLPLWLFFMFGMKAKAMRKGMFNKAGEITGKIREQVRLVSVNALSVMQFRIPALTLSWFGNISMVGNFSAGMRFLTFLRIIPGAMLNALIPAYSRKEKNLPVMSVSLMALGIGVIISVVLYYTAGPLMALTFNFTEAIPVLRVLAWSHALVMYNISMEAWLISKKLEKNINYSLFLSAVLVFLITALFIGTRGAIAGAWAVLAGESLLAFIYTILFVIKRKRI